MFLNTCSKLRAGARRTISCILCPRTCLCFCVAGFPRIPKRYHELGLYARVGEAWGTHTPELSLLYGNLATFRTKNQAWSSLLTGVSTLPTALQIAIGPGLP